MSGHNDLIHDLDWSWDDRFLVSASADGRVCVWNLQDREQEHGDSLNYHNNDHLYFVAEMYHPTFVYGARLHPKRDDANLYIATICYDKKVRIWKCEIENLELPQCSCKLEMSIED